MSAGRHSLLHALVIGVASMGLTPDAIAARPAPKRPVESFFPDCSRGRKPTSNKDRRDARDTNRPKNKAARQSRKRNKK